MFDGGEGHYSFLAAVYPTCQPDIFSKAITRLGHKAPTLVGFIMYDRVEEDGPQMSIARAYIGNNTHNGD